MVLAEEISASLKKCLEISSSWHILSLPYRPQLASLPLTLSWWQTLYLGFFTGFGFCGEAVPAVRSAAASSLGPQAGILANNNSSISIFLCRHCRLIRVLKPNHLYLCNKKIPFHIYHCIMPNTHPKNPWFIPLLSCIAICTSKATSARSAERPTSVPIHFRAFS